MGPSNLVAVCLFPADNLAPNTPFPPANHQDPLKCGYRIQEICFMKSPQTTWPSNTLPFMYGQVRCQFHNLSVNRLLSFHSKPFWKLTRSVGVDQFTTRKLGPWWQQWLRPFFKGQCDLWYMHGENSLTHCSVVISSWSASLPLARDVTYHPDLAPKSWYNYICFPGWIEVFVWIFYIILQFSKSLNVFLSKWVAKIIFDRDFS